MMELPESATIARQLNETVRGRTIGHVEAGRSPHKFAFYRGDPGDYGALLTGETVGDSFGLGAMVEICAGSRRIVLGDGANLRYYADAQKAPDKHQLLILFEDGSALCVSVQMYGSILAFREGEYDNPYYLTAKEKPQPGSVGFDRPYFDRLRTEDAEKLSAKAFLATKQRIPGLGNGVLQDILFRAGIHPKRPAASLSADAYTRLYDALTDTLSEMTARGGRDTEKDLFGCPGGYQTLLSKNTVGGPCPVCGTDIRKAAYLGGAVYWCPLCQPEKI